METLTFQPPLLGESRAIDELREFIVGVSLRSEPVLITGPEGTGKSLAVGKIHAIGPHASTPCCCVDGATLTEDELLEAIEFSGSEGGAGSLYIRNADLLDESIAREIARRICEEPSGPRFLLSSREDLDSPRWGCVREAGLFALITQLHREIPPLAERLEDLPVLCRYQMWLHTLPENFEEEWDAFESGPLEDFLDQPWLGNVSELIEVLGEYCGVVDEGTPRRWSGDEGRATAQEEFLRQELEEAFEEVKALLREDECEGTEWILPHPRREIDDPEGDPDE